MIKKQPSKQEVSDHLRGAGISPTSQRVEIAYYLFNRWEHLSADQVLDGVNQEYPAVSRGTVYNALNLLVEKGLILEVIAAPNKIFYDPNPTPHHHFYHVSMGTLIDVPPGVVTIGDVPVPDGCEIDRVDVVVRLRC